MLARRAAHILMNAYDAATGLLTVPRSRSGHAGAADAQSRQRKMRHLHRHRPAARAEREPGPARRRRGDRQGGRTDRRGLAPRMLASRISGDRFAMLDVRRDAGSRRRFTENAARRTGARLRRGTAVECPPASAWRASPMASTLAHALAAAEIACKAAKDRGRNRVEVYEESDQSIVVDTRTSRWSERCATRSPRLVPPRGAVHRAAQRRAARRPTSSCCCV